MSLSEVERKGSRLLVLFLAVGFALSIGGWMLWKYDQNVHWEANLRSEMRHLYSLSKDRGPYHWLSSVEFRDVEYLCLIQGIILLKGKPNPPHDPGYDGYITLYPTAKKGGTAVPGYPAFVITPSGEVYRHESPGDLPERFVSRLDMVTGGELSARATLLLDFKDSPESWSEYGKITMTQEYGPAFMETAGK